MYCTYNPVLISAQESSPEDLIKVTSVDLQIKANTISHHTNEFDITDPMIYDRYT